MRSTKSAGIWMDHSHAHVMEFTIDPIKTTTIESTFTAQTKEESLDKSEHLMHNKQQQQQSAYYKKLGAVIKTYTHVLLFGPTNARVELFNMLQADEQFKNVKIDVQQADKMTAPQEHAFVRNHFSGKF
ncbi:MAG: hypothetical protein ABIR15_18705 [Chitinophagaceae bacterium]